MIQKESRSAVRARRHLRVRAKISGTAECPRLVVFRSNKHIEAQLIDDTKGMLALRVSNSSLLTAPTAKPLPKLVKLSPIKPKIKASPRSSSTVVVTNIMGVLPPSPKPHVKPASCSKEKNYG